MSTFNGVNLVITLDSTGTGSGEVDWQDVYSEWKDWMLSSTLNRKFPHAFTPDGGAPLTSIIDQGRYYFLNNKGGWRVKPPEEDITYYAVGNLAVNDTSIPALLPTDGAFTAAILGLQPITQGVTPVMAQQLAFGSFSGGVWVDQTNGTSGTGLIEGEPIGNAKYPSNNFTDARAICLVQGLPQTFFVIGNAILDTGDDISGFVVVGQNASRSMITVNDGADTLGCEILEAYIIGNLDGGTILRSSVIQNLNYVNGFVYGCMLNPGTISLGGATTAHFLNCYSGIPGVSTPIIDMNGVTDDQDTPLAIRGYNGGIKLIDKTGSGSVSIDLASGQVIIDLTCTNGTIVVRGDGKVIDSLGNHMLSGTYNGNLILINECNYGDHVHDIWQSLGLNPDAIGTGDVIDVLNSVKNDTKYLEHCIYIDTELLTGGDGSQLDPFGNITDAIDKAEELNIYHLVISSSIDIDRDIKNFVITGIGTPTVDTGGFNLDGCEFSHCTMRGDYTGIIIVQQCYLKFAFTLNGTFEKCGISSTFTVPNLGSAVLIDCSSVVLDLVLPTIDLGGALGTATLVVTGQRGGLNLLNSTQVTDSSKLNMGTGNVLIDSSCTNGTIVASGIGKLTDNSIGKLVIDAMISADDIKDIHLAENGRRKSVGLVDTIYEEDLVTPRKVFDITKDGNGEVIEIVPQ